MQLHYKIPLVDLDILNPLITDYLAAPEKLAQLYTFDANLKGIGEALDKKQNFGNRQVLHDSLQAQYKDVNLSAAAKANLDALLDPQTFTVCTAHQLCLFTGPSYFIYKILSAIKLSKDLKENFPNQNFVPVYWMGSEDHDFEEINHAYIYGKKVTWENEESGAIGLRTLKGIPEVIASLKDILGTSEHATAFIANLEKHFTNKINYGKAFQSWILDLFGAYGLIVLDQNDPALKRAFAPVMEDELLHLNAEKALVKNAKFLDDNYHIQATARPLNLFYLKGQIRERIELQEGQYHVLNTDIVFDEIAIKKEIQDFPERFSPNVILRPLYQESVLPNVAFIGGPGELAYWLQLKDVFSHHQIVQPAIMLRDMAVIMPKNHLERLSTWEISVKDLFAHYDQIAKEIVENESQNELSLMSEKEAISSLFEQIKAKALAIDNNMGRSVEAEQQKVFNALDNLESKLLRSEKKNFEQKLNQLENIQQKLLPNNTLQERHDNFIPNYLKYQEQLFTVIEQSLDVFEHQLKVFEA